jgi:hypothetical protein
MSTSRRHPVLVATTAAGLSAVLVGGFASAAVGAPQRPAASGDTITGGSVSITLSSSVLKALKHDHVHLAAVKPSTLKGNKLKAPVTGGTFSLLAASADVKTSGGFTIAKGGKSVTISKLESMASTGAGSGTAVVSGHGRITAITTTAPSSLLPSGNSVSASGFTVSLSNKLVKILDAKFGTTLFKSHAKLGAGAVTFTYKG